MKYVLLFTTFILSLSAFSQNTPMEEIITITENIHNMERNAKAARLAPLRAAKTLRNVGALTTLSGIGMMVGGYSIMSKNSTKSSDYAGAILMGTGLVSTLTGGILWKIGEIKVKHTRVLLNASPLAMSLNYSF